MICACLKQNRVVGLLEFQNEDEFHQMEHDFDLMIDISNYPLSPQIGYEYDSNSDQFNYGQLSISPSVKITKLAFRNRFSSNEKIAILQKSEEQSAYGFAVASSIQDQMSATYIDLMRPDTRAGVQMLATLGLISSDRVTVILDTPPSSEEIFRG